MGMDVHGLNPKQNKNIDDFPVMKRFDSMDFSEKWKILDKDEALRDEYWKEKDKWEKDNPGIYFRNNVWWWRPLWNYCYHVAEDIIEPNMRRMEYKFDADDEPIYEESDYVKADFDNGHSNDGSGLDDKHAKLLGNRLMETIADGTAIKYQAHYLQLMEDADDDDFSKNYPFDVDNVERFALFCIESGGFEIC